MLTYGAQGGVLEGGQTGTDGGNKTRREAGEGGRFLLWLMQVVGGG